MFLYRRLKVKYYTKIIQKKNIWFTGLSSDDRSLIENLFRSGILRVLVSTTTLALGVNLPAHLVVIKSTTHMVAGAYKELEESQVSRLTFFMWQKQGNRFLAEIVSNLGLDNKLLKFFNLLRELQWSLLLSVKKISIQELMPHH